MRTKNEYIILTYSYVASRVGQKNHNHNQNNKTMAKLSDNIIDFDGLIGLQLQIVDAGLLKDLVVHYSLRWGGLKLTRSYFNLMLPRYCSHQLRRRKAFPRTMPIRWPYQIVIADRRRLQLCQWSDLLIEPLRACVGRIMAPIKFLKVGCCVLCIFLSIWS